LDLGTGVIELAFQRAARALARRFDAAFRQFGITQGQFSLMMSLNRPEPPTMGEVAPFLAVDRTTRTAALKPLTRRDLVTVTPDKTDARTKRLSLTDKGRALLAEALPVWRAEHDAVDLLLLADLELLRGRYALPRPQRAGYLPGRAARPAGSGAGRA